MKFTVNELAAHLGVSYQEAYALLTYLKAKGVAKATGIRPSTGKWRGSTEYELPASLELVFEKVEGEAAVAA